MKSVLSNIQDLELIIQIFLWLIGILLSVIGILGSFVLWYVIKVFKGTEELSGKVSKIRSEAITFRKTVGDTFFNLQTSQESIRKRLHKLQRAVVSGTMVLKRRREETRQFLAESKRARDQLDSHQKALEKSVRVLRAQDSEIKLIRTKLINLNEQLTLVTSNKSKPPNGSK